ncbi:hypothetical protein [Nocardia sp. NPDC051570]|uniref:hypothetical protein n=1 Tax=Nocardia sp. NPDC051570 TaxID=3364324 RepID=UPI00379370A1
MIVRAVAGGVLAVSVPRAEAWIGVGADVTLLGYVLVGTVRRGADAVDPDSWYLSDDSRGPSVPWPEELSSDTMDPWQQQPYRQQQILDLQSTTQADASGQYRPADLDFSTGLRGVRQVKASTTLSNWCSRVVNGPADPGACDRADLGHAGPVSDR